MLPYDMIAQAYQEHLSYGAHCFIRGPLMGTIPEPYIIDDDFEIDDYGNLTVVYKQHSGYQKYFYINDAGDLICRITEGGEIMSEVNLGHVVGSQGPQGPEGPQGPQGISPTFYIQNGNIYADYDHPYDPNE